MDLLPTAPDVLTVQEAGKVLRLGRTTMYRLVASGEIKCVKIGRKVLIPRIFLQNFLEDLQEKCYNISISEADNLPCCEKGAEKCK